MIYAIGQTHQYAAKFASPKPLYKVGKGLDARGRPYPGGSVWRTEEDAKAYIVANGLTATHMVLRVIADWETDTEQLAGEPYRRLLRHALILPPGAPPPPSPARQPGKTG